MRGPSGWILGTGLVAAALAAAAPAALAQCTSIECQKLAAPAAEAGQLFAFGRKPAIDGNLAVVTSDAEDDRGAAYAYELQGGQWVSIQHIVPADIAIADLFGKAAEIAGLRMVIAAPNDDDDGGGSGSAYAYEFNGTQWQQVQKITASDAQAGDSFGWAMSMAGNVLVVGAINEDALGLNTGAAYVFRHDGLQWVEEQQLLPGVPGANDQFGFSVATDGAVVVVGTPNVDTMGSDSGAAYVYRYDGATWVPEQTLLASDGAANDWFGWSVAVEGATILVGATRQDVTATDTGAVYEWRYNGTNWGQTEMFAAVAPTANAQFGWALDLDGDRLAVSAPGKSAGQGAIYVFVDEVTGWEESCQLLGSAAPGAGIFNDSLGAGLALQGPHLIGGAPFADGAVTDAGAAYVYMLDENGESTCTGPGAGSIPDGADVPGTPLKVRKVPGGKIRLGWAHSCQTDDTNYGVYQGTIGDFTTHAIVTCSTSGQPSYTFTPGGGSHYYLVVPSNGFNEGSYGRDSDDEERLPADVPCMDQNIASCQ